MRWERRTIDAPLLARPLGNILLDSQAYKISRLPRPDSCNPRLTIVVRQHQPTRTGFGCVPNLEVGRLVVLGFRVSIAWRCRRHQNASGSADCQRGRYAGHQNHRYQDSHRKDPNHALHELTSYSPRLCAYDSRLRHLMRSRVKIPVRVSRSTAVQI